MHTYQYSNQQYIYQYRRSPTHSDKWQYRYKRHLDADFGRWTQLLTDVIEQEGKWIHLVSVTAKVV